MTDYITLTIDEQIMETLIWIVIATVFILITWIIIDMIGAILKDSKREKWKIKCKPYRKKYKELKDTEKYDEARKYYDKYYDYLRGGDYY